MVRIIFISLMLVSNYTWSNKCTSTQRTLSFKDTVEQITYEVCDDQKHAQYQVGYVSDLVMFREHPIYKKPFNYKNTTCKWFMDSKLEDNIRHYEGIICELTPNRWTVIDRF